MNGRPTCIEGILFEAPLLRTAYQPGGYASHLRTIGVSIQYGHLSPRLDHGSLRWIIDHSERVDSGRVEAPDAPQCANQMGRYLQGASLINFAVGSTRHMGKASDMGPLLEIVP